MLIISLTANDNILPVTNVGKLKMYIIYILYITMAVNTYLNNKNINFTDNYGLLLDG